MYRVANNIILIIVIKSKKNNLNAEICNEPNSDNNTMTIIVTSSPLYSSVCIQSAPIYLHKLRP